MYTKGADAEKKALRAWRLSQRLNDGRKLVLALRHYDSVLPIGKWTRLSPPRRERSRRLNHEREWLAHLTAARRLAGIKSRRAVDDKGKPYTEYYLGANIWTSASSRLCLKRPVPESGGDLREPLWLSEGQRKKASREEQRQETDFKCALLDPELAWQFKSLPVLWRVTGPIQNFSERLPLLLEQTKEYLLRDIDEETQARFALESQNKREQAAERIKTAPGVSNLAPRANATQTEAFNHWGEPRRRKRKPPTVESEMARQIRNFLIRQSIGN